MTQHTAHAKAIQKLLLDSVYAKCGWSVHGQLEQVVEVSADLDDINQNAMAHAKEHLVTLGGSPEVDGAIFEMVQLIDDFVRDQNELDERRANGDEDE